MTENKDAESFVEKYAPPDDRGETNVHPITGDLQCYGIAKANSRPPAMIVFRLKTGDQKAMMYSYLVEIDFNPSDGMTLRFVNHEVIIKGKDLEPIFSRLIEHRVTWIQAVSQPQIEPDGMTVISSIEVRKI